MSQLTVDFWTVKALMFFFSPFMSDEQYYQHQCEEGQRYYEDVESKNVLVEVDYDYWV